MFLILQVRNGVAIVRPPGHHAEEDKACGFCFFNTAALTARYAQSITSQSLRVLILDWDVHHGNGTQHIFEEDDRLASINLSNSALWDICFQRKTVFPVCQRSLHLPASLRRRHVFPQL